MYKRERPTPEEEIARIKLPRGNQTFGIVLELLGSSKMRVECEDEKPRICRIPGRLRRRMWVRPGDLIIVEPWEVQGHERGDVIWKYTRTQANWLNRNKKFSKIIYG
jgi:translation initiation factor 1A